MRRKKNTKWVSKQAIKHFKRRDKVLGQFWTPQEVADFIVSFAAKYVEEKGIACDPACGDGVFLRSLKKEGFEPYGVDIDSSILIFLPKDIAKNIQIGNGLKLDEKVKFNLVVGNPPFSSKYGRIRGPILEEFELGKNKASQAIEILFLEKFIRLCKDGGVIGIILPQGIFSNIKLSYVRKFIRKNLTIIAIFSLPRNIFRNGHTTSKTCILIGKKERPHQNKKIMFGVVEKLDEIKIQKVKKTVRAYPDEFLYPEFYIDKNPLLDRLPRLKEFNVEIKQGRTKYGKDRIFSESGIPFISAKTITFLGIDFSKDRKFVKPNSPMDYKNAYVQIGDLVFVRVGVGCIGRVAVVSSEDEKGIADDWIYIIRVKDKRISPYYLAFWLQTPIVQKEIRRLARGVGTVTIPISLMFEIPILVPERRQLEWFKAMYLKMLSNRKEGKVTKAKKIYELVLKSLENFSSLE